MGFWGGPLAYRIRYRLVISFHRNPPIPCPVSPWWIRPKNPISFFHPSHTTFRYLFTPLILLLVWANNSYLVWYGPSAHIYCKTALRQYVRDKSYHNHAVTPSILASVSRCQKYWRATSSALEKSEMFLAKWQAYFMFLSPEWGKVDATNLERVYFHPKLDLGISCRWYLCESIHRIISPHTDDTESGHAARIPFRRVRRRWPYSFVPFLMCNVWLSIYNHLSTCHSFLLHCSPDSLAFSHWSLHSNTLILIGNSIERITKHTSHVSHPLLQTMSAEQVVCKTAKSFWPYLVGFLGAYSPPLPRKLLASIPILHG